jgi:hypothetical protein
MALSGCASMQETQVVDDTLMNIIGDEGRIREYQHYVSQSIELRRINSGKIIETIVINPQSKGIVTGVTETEKGEKLMKISFGSNDETLSFFKSDNEGKYYLLYNNGETIKYGANEYKISYYYVGGERPYLYIKMDKRVYNAKGRPVRGKQE